MPINKLLRTLILAIVAIGLVLVIFFSLTIFYSKPVNIYGKEKKPKRQIMPTALFFTQIR
jgi:hypothetical protein